MTKMNLKKLYKASKGYRPLFALFIISTSFFIYQHSTGISWDFASYVLNSKFFIGQSLFFEWVRPPLMSLMLIPLSIFGWAAAEYAFIVLISLLHFFVSIKLAKEMKIDPKIFYSLTLMPFLLNMSFIGGTELLSLALLELSVLFIFREKDSYFSGLFMGLAFLARYTNFIFLPLLLFNKKIKNTALSVIFFILPVIPWLAYNYLVSGNALMSIASGYFINISSRSNFFDATILKNLLLIAQYYWLLIIPGLIFGKKNKAYYIMAFFALLVFLSYLKIPLKSETRYLFNFLLPAAYFSAVFFERFKRKNFSRILFYAVILLNLTMAVFFFSDLDDRNMYKNASAFMDRNCTYMSNVWVPLNYIGFHTEPAYVETNKEYVKSAIDSGKRIIYFKKAINPDYNYVQNRTFIESLGIANETPDYVILGEGCNEPKLFREDFGIDNCRLFLTGFLEKFCIDFLE